MQQTSRPRKFQNLPSWGNFDTKNQKIEKNKEKNHPNFPEKCYGLRISKFNLLHFDNIHQIFPPFLSPIYDGNFRKNENIVPASLWVTGCKLNKVGKKI